MKKIDFEKLKKEKIGILFDTEEEMIEFLKECDKKNITWSSGAKASKKNFFNCYDQFVITINYNRDKSLEYASKGFYESERYKIIKYKELVNKTCEASFKEIKKIIVNGESTIVFWNDDTKTIVKRGKGQKNNQELAILYAYFQKNSGLSKTKANKTIQDLTNSIYYQG